MKKSPLARIGSKLLKLARDLLCMDDECIEQWLKPSIRRCTVLAQLTQPLTSTQLANRTDMTRVLCSFTLKELSVYTLVKCLNCVARTSRLYWLTGLGTQWHGWAREQCGLSPCERLYPEVDWRLYGWTCYRHRAAIIKALDRPLQPSEIKRRARMLNPLIRMSANNVRNVIREFCQHGIVVPVRERGSVHPRYVLTPAGEQFRALLLAAEVRQ